MEKYLVRIIKILLAATLFLPLVVSSKFFFPFIVPRDLLFRTIIEFASILYLFLIFYHPKYRPKFNFLTKAVCAFFAVLLVSSIFGVNFSTSLFGDYERMGGLIHLSHIFLYFLILINIFRQEEEWHNLFIVTIFVSTLMAFIGLAQSSGISVILKSGGGDRITGSIGNASFFAGYLFLNLCLIFYLVWRRKFNLKLFAFFWLGLDSILIGYELYLRVFKHGLGFITSILPFKLFVSVFLGLQFFVFLTYFLNKKKSKDLSRYLLALIFIFQAYILYQTQTRGAVVASYLVVQLILLFYIFLAKQKKLKILACVGFVLLISVPLFFYANRNAKWIEKYSTLNRLSKISFNDVTTKNRLVTWQASWKGMLDKPVLGWGVENYKIVFNKYFPPEIFQDQGSQIWFDRAHNIIFDVGVTTGFVGLIIYLLIYIAGFFQIKKQYKESGDFSQTYLLFIFLLGYFFQNLFVFDTLNSELLFYLILGFIVYLDFRNKFFVPEKQAEIEKKDYNVAILTVLFLIFLMVSYNLNAKTWQANNLIYHHLLIKAQLKTVQYNQEAVDVLKESINKSRIGHFEARQQLTNYAMDLSRQSGSQNNYQIAELGTYCVNELKKSVKEEPLDVRHYLYLATLENYTYKFDQTRLQDVINILTEAIPLSPTRPQIYFERGQAYINSNQYEKGIEDFKKGIELSPWANDSYWNLAVAYILSNKQVEADKIFNYLTEKKKFNYDTVENLNKLVNIYGRVENWQKVLETLKKLVNLDPNNGAYHARLAAGYEKVGDKKMAKEEVLKAMELDPSLQEEGQKFLEYLKNS